MANLNWLLVLFTGLVPLIIGGVWYGPLFSKLWMREAGITEEMIKGSNMIKIFGLTLVFGIMLATALTPIVIHQMGVFSVLQNMDITTPGSEAKTFLDDFMSKYGTNFRSFKHGALHGFISGLFIFLPVIGTNALFERKSFKYLLIHVGFWTLSAMIMGGIICAWA